MIDQMLGYPANPIQTFTAWQHFSAGRTTLLNATATRTFADISTTFTFVFRHSDLGHAPSTVATTSDHAPTQ
jgi:hypothetical protein